MTPDTIEQNVRLYLVADPEQARHDLVEETAAALAGGVSMVQLRAKTLSDRACFELATTLLRHCRDRAVPFLVNDRVDVALATGADGVHLGVDDLPIEDARRLLGPNAIIGFSPETDDQARTAAQRGASYLGIGPVFGTMTKADAGAPVGPETVARRARLSGLPVIGIGGITVSNALDVISAGAAGVAVVTAILGHSDPAEAARRLATAVHQACAPL